MSLTLRALLKTADTETVARLHAAWLHDTLLPSRRGELHAALTRAFAREDLLEDRLKQLPKKLADVLECFLAVPERVCTVQAILAAPHARWQSRFDAEAAVAALCREGFVLPVETSGAAACYAIPAELTEPIDLLRRRQNAELRATITLQGFLQARYFDPQQRAADPEGRAEDHARKVYKLYLMDSSVQARLRRLPQNVRRLVDIVLTKYGGLMPAAELNRVFGPDEPLDLDLVKKSLEEAVLGTVAPLRLQRYGLQPVMPAIVLFYEIMLLSLPSHSARVPVQVEEPMVGGVDLVSNLGRLLREFGSSKVQFTAEGQIYKASEKRIVKRLIPLPLGFLDPQAQLRFLYSFCLARSLVDRSGERALRSTDAGLQFEQLPLADKVRSLLAFAVEERGTGGEDFHHVRLRRILLRLLKRLEPEQWHELAFLPFLARNGYLSTLAAQRAEEFFATRYRAGAYTPSESVHELGSHLVLFVKRRLFPLGLVDLGLRGSRPVAMRLSRFGAELLGALPAAEVGGERSTIVVNPDFEVILYPGDDEHEVVHTFDRFTERVKADHVYLFKLNKQSIEAGLKDGLTVSQVLLELTDRCRAPLPQNVVYSLEDWADQAGVLVVQNGVLQARRSEQIERFLGLPAVKPFVAERLNATAVRLRADVPLGDLQGAVRDLGFFVEVR